jgi:hypothetical protein
MQNKYHVYNTLGQQIFFVQEGQLHYISRTCVVGVATAKFENFFF